ncbi:MAG: hypothetical protein EAX95_16000 [Candidatus Thorarchaeota archaeon]|nr:hypothetical protein [Candidatus Thorarchaeota archaeon]
MPPDWYFTNELSGTTSEITLPIWRYEGLAKICQSLLYVDWIRGKLPKPIMYSLGPPLDAESISVIPLGFVRSVNGGNGRDTNSLGFTIGMPTDISKDSLQDIRRRFSFDYHPIPEFKFQVRFKKLKGESKEELALKKEHITDLIRGSTPLAEADISWRLAFTSYIGPFFKPAFWGRLTIERPKPLNRTTPPKPMTEDEYMKLLLGTFTDDAIDYKEEAIEGIQTVWGSDIIYHEYTQPSMPIPAGGSGGTQRIHLYSMAVLGSKNSVSAEDIQEFSKSCFEFAYNKRPRGMNMIAVFPVLMTNQANDNAKEWVHKTVEPSRKGISVPGIMELGSGTLHFCEKVPFRGRLLYYLSIAFPQRYLMTEEMRHYKEPPSGVQVKCPFCGSIYWYDQNGILANG